MKTGGVRFNSMCNLTKIDEKMVQMILHEYSNQQTKQKVILAF